MLLRDETSAFRSAAKLPEFIVQNQAAFIRTAMHVLSLKKLQRINHVQEIKMSVQSVTQHSRTLDRPERLVRELRVGLQGVHLLYASIDFLLNTSAPDGEPYHVRTALSIITSSLVKTNSTDQTMFYSSTRERIHDLSLF